MRVRRGGLQLGDHLARLGVGEEEVDAEQVELAQVGHVAAVGRELRRDVDGPRLTLPGEQASRGEGRERVRVGEQARAARALALGNALGAVAALLGDGLQFVGRALGAGHRAACGRGEKLLAEGGFPALREGLLRQTGHSHDGRVERHLQGRPEELHARLVAVGARDEGPEGLAVLVLVVGARPLQLPDGREVVAEAGVTHPHGRESVLAADGVVLGHALDHEQRQAHELREAPGPLREVVLELVDELVAEHVVGFGVGPGHRQHDALAGALRDALRALADVGDVGLPEVRVVGVEDDRLALVELVLQDGREAVVPALGHPRHVARGLVHALVVVDVEVLGLEDPEVEVVVADLVAAEVLGLGGGRQGGEQSDHQEGLEEPAGG